ncbi:MAG: hypothetical protein HOV81_28285 [Kofleriaceae bacterium]|nr:hypothetical protein [Kofleriaceae bacterium]
MALSVGVGVAKQSALDTGYYPEIEDLSPTVEASLGYRFPAVATLPSGMPVSAAVGIRAGLSRYTTPESGDPDLVVETWHREVRALDLGAICILQVDRFSVAPWLGARFANSRLATTAHDLAHGTDETSTMTFGRPILLSGGVTVGADLYASGPHRFTLFLTAQLTSSSDFDGDLDDSPDYRYSAITVGGAYRL